METNEMGATDREFSASEMEQVKEARKPEIQLRIEKENRQFQDIINKVESIK